MGSEGVKGTVTEEVTHDALAAAYDAIGEEEKVEDAPAVNEPAEEGDESSKAEAESVTGGEDEGNVPRGTETEEEQKERSRLGRKLKKLEDKFDRVLSALEQKVVQGPLVPSSPPAQATSQDDAEELEAINELYFTNPVGAMERYSAYKQSKQSHAVDIYKSTYINKLSELAKSEGDVYNEVIDMMVAQRDKYDITHSDGRSPDLDAHINFMAAKAAVMAKHAESGTKPTYRGKGDVTKPPAKPAGTQTSEASRPKAAPKLDAPAGEFAKYLSKHGRMTESEIAEAVG